MTTALQFIVPFVTALSLLGLFHLVAYLHIQLFDAEQVESDDEFGEPAAP